MLPPSDSLPHPTTEIITAANRNFRIVSGRSTLIRYRLGLLVAGLL
jgi:hypothetical protein